MKFSSWKIIDEKIEEVDKSFNYLTSPAMLPIAYEAALSEVSRRREFDKIFNSEYAKFQQFLKTEYEKRVKFRYIK